MGREEPGWTVAVLMAQAHRKQCYCSCMLSGSNMIGYARVGQESSMGGVGVGVVVGIVEGVVVK